MKSKNCPNGKYIKEYYYDNYIQLHVMDEYYSCKIDNDIYELNHECSYFKERKDLKMIETIRYCDICKKKINEHYEQFYQLALPDVNNNGEIILFNDKRDVCKNCLQQLYLKIIEIKLPN